MFWGLVLEPEKTYAQVVDTPFHLSMAALDLKKSDAQEEASTLILRQDDVEYVLGNLSKKHKIFNVPLALDFDMGEEIEFAVVGSSQIHLTGFLADQDDMVADEELEDEEASSDTERKIKEIKKAQAAKRKLNDSDKSPAGSKKQRILDQSFNDDTDEDDFDVTENDFDSDDDGSEDLGEEEEEDDDDDDDDDEDDDMEEEIAVPKKQKQQSGQTPEAGKKKQKQLQQQQQQNKQGGQPQNKQGGQQPNKQGQQQQQKGQKSPQKNQQSNKTPQKTPQPNKNQQQNQQKTPQQANKTPQGKQGKTPQQVNKPPKKVVKGVVIEDVAEGTGKLASSHKKVGVYYVGRLANNKKEFDKAQGGDPFRFVLGRGEVIPGWDIGVDGMKVGGKRKLTIPANLAYGRTGAPPAIPPNSNLEFEVTLVSVK